MCVYDILESIILFNAHSYGVKHLAAALCFSVENLPVLLFVELAQSEQE